LELFQLILKAAPEFREEMINQKYVYAQLFPKKVYQGAKFNRLKNQLLNSLTNFLVELELEEEKHLRSRMLVRALDARGMEANHVRKVLKDAKEELEDYPYSTAFFHFDTYRLAQQSLSVALKHGNRDLEVGLEKTNHHLDVFFVAQKLKFFCAMIQRQHIVARKYTFSFWKEIHAYVANMKEVVPVIQAYYSILRLFEVSAGEKEYEEARKLLEVYGDSFNEEDFAHLYTSFLNFGSRQYKRGNMEYLHKAFEVSQRIAEKNLLDGYASMTAHFYKNTVALGIKLKEFEWTKSFIHSFRSKIDAQYQEGTFAYNMAYWHFSQGQYRDAKRHLQRVEFIDPFYRLNYSILLLKTDYECEEIESFLSSFDTVRMYIKRNKSLSAANKETYYNFIKFVKKLLLIKTSPAKWKQFARLQTQIEENKWVVQYEWLQAKVEELANQFKDKIPN